MGEGEMTKKARKMYIVSEPDKRSSRQIAIEMGATPREADELIRFVRKLLKKNPVVLKHISKKT